MIGVEIEKAVVAAAMKTGGEAEPILRPPPGPTPPEPLPKVLAPSTFKPPQQSAPQSAPTPTTPSAPQTPPVSPPPPPSRPGSAGDADATAASDIAAGGSPQPQPQPQPQQPQQPQQQQQTQPGQEPAPKTPPPQRDPDKSLIDHAADIGTWAQENYIDLAAIPIGAALMLFGGKMGAVLGALAMGGGAYGLYDRFQNLNNMGADIAIPEGTPPEQADEMRKDELKRRWSVMEEASADEDSWSRWMSDPENAKFYQSLNLVHRFMPQILRSKAREANPLANWLDDDELDAELQSRLHGRLGSGGGGTQ